MLVDENVTNELAKGNCFIILEGKRIQVFNSVDIILLTVDNKRIIGFLVDLTILQ